MPNRVAEQASTAAASCPFLRAQLVLFPTTLKHQDVGAVLVHISTGVRCIRASSDPQHDDDFADCDIIIELQRVRNNGDDPDEECSSSDGSRLSKALMDSAVDVVAPYPILDGCGLSIYGRVMEREQDQCIERRRRKLRDTGYGEAWLVARTPEERDVWLLLFRARVAPVKLWYKVCQSQALKWGLQSYAQLRLFSHDPSRQGSQREIADALLRERTRWMHESTNAHEEPALPYGEGSADDVSDAALLLPASVMQVMELSTRVGAAADKPEFTEWHEGSAALWTMKTHSKRVCAAVRVVVSAAMAEDGDSSTRSVLDALIGCWDSLLIAKESLHDISITNTISDTTKRLLKSAEKSLLEHASKANLAQPSLAPQPDDRLARVTTSDRDGPYKTSLSVNIPCSGAVVKEGSPQYDRIVDELLNTGVTDNVQPVAVTAVSGEGGAGKTTACMLALHDSRVTNRFKDGVFGFEIGLDAQAKNLIKKIANIVRECQGFATARSINNLINVEEAAEEARHFFRNRCILLYLDNAWPDSRALKDMMSITSGRGSCVLFSTRSATLAKAYTDRVVELGMLRLEIASEKAAAESIFYKHLQSLCDHEWCTRANVDEALSISQGFPIAIATVAALIRSNLVRRIRTNVLGQVAANLRSPSTSHSMNQGHMGLFAAMAESLEFLDGQHSEIDEIDGGSRGLMTRRYASLHALDMSENRINTSVLSIAWNTCLEDAEKTAGEFFRMGLVRLGSPGADSLADGNGTRPSDTLTLHDLQVEYSTQVADSDSHGITVEDIHTTAVRGIFEGDVDIDLLDASDYVERCEELCESDKGNEDLVGRYVVSNLVRHLVGSLCPNNASRRWPTIRRLLSDARWLLLWQRVDGWAFVCNYYAMLWERLSTRKGMVELIPKAEAEAIVEVGRAAQTVLVTSFSCVGKDVEKSAVEIYFRLHASWQEGCEGLSRAVLQRALRSLCVVAGRWWMRPMTACRGPPVRDRRLRIAFAASSTPINGCALIGFNSHVVMCCCDGVVRLHDRVGVMVAEHKKHSELVNDVCVGHTGGDTDYRVFSVSDDGKLVRWEVSLPAGTSGQTHAAAPVVVDSTENTLVAVACSDDASVVAAGAGMGVLYLWVLNWRRGLGGCVFRVEARKHKDQVRCVAVSSDGATVLSGSIDGTCLVWGVQDALSRGVALPSPGVLEQGCGKEGWVITCAFASEERVAVFGHQSSVVRFWSVADKTLLGKVDLQSGLVFSLAAVGRGGDEVVAGTFDGRAHIVRVSNRTVAAQLGRDNHDAVRAVSTSRNARGIVVCGHKSGQLRVWDADNTVSTMPREARRATPETQQHELDVANARLRTHGGTMSSFVVNSVSTSSCGHFVATGGSDGVVRCWHLETGMALWTRDLGSPVTCVCIAADGRHVACGCVSYEHRHGGCTVRVLDMSDGEIVLSWAHDRSVYCVCMQELGDGFVWSGHSDGEVVAWSLEKSTPAHRVRGLREDKVVNLCLATGARCVYLQDSCGRIARVDIADNRISRISRMLDISVPGHGQSQRHAFGDHTAQGFRSGKRDWTHTRVRHACGDKVYEITATATPERHILNVELHLPGCTSTVFHPTIFDSNIRVVDASFVTAPDGDCSFAQVVCLLFDDSVRVLRQPLGIDAHQWHPAESSQ